MNRVFSRRLGMLVLACLLLAGCGRPAQDPSTPSPATSNQRTPATPSDQASPPAANTGDSRSWTAKPVLITLGTSPGYTANNVAWATMPGLVIYADGTVVTSSWESQGQTWRHRIGTAQLSSGELCALLGQIDAYGFFDFDPSDYQAPNVTDNGTTVISVEAWRSKTVAAYALDWALDPPGSGSLIEAMSVPAPLSDTYALLSGYTPANLQPYQPERIALLIEPGSSETSGAAPIWPLESPSLKDLAARIDPGQQYPEIVLDGQQAAEIHGLLSEERSPIYSEDGLIYNVTMRSLLPYEVWEPTTGWGHDSQFAATPTVEMSCDVAGAVAQPTPTAGMAAPTAGSTATAQEIDQSAPLDYAESLGERDAPGQFAFTGPVMVNRAGEVLVADSSNDRIQVFSLDGQLLGTRPLTDSYAADLAMLPDGRFLVANSLDNRLELHAADGTLERTITGWPAPQEKPRGGDDVGLATWGNDGAFYLAERYGDRVVMLNADGSLREIWNGPAATPFAEITALETDADGNLYVAIEDQDRIVKRGPDGQTAEFAVTNPAHLAIGADGAIYVAGEISVAIYAADGSQVRQWRDEKLRGIKDLAPAPDGSVVVVDHDLIDGQATVIHRYGQDGAHLAGFGSTLLLPGQFEAHSAFAVSTLGDVWLMETGDGISEENDPPTRLVHLDAQGRHLKTIEALDGKDFECDAYLLAAPANGHAFVADPCAGSVTEIDSEGAIVARWGQRGRAAGSFNVIADMALAPDEQSLYIADLGQRAVAQYALNGQLIKRWDAEELGVKEPGALAVDADGGLYLLDMATQQIVVRPPQGGDPLAGVRAWSLPEPDEGLNRIAVDAERGRIYVGSADLRLFVFDMAGAYLGGRTGGDKRGVMVEVGPGGRVYRSGGYNRIQIYAPR